MVTLAWGNVLAILLPGVLVLYGLRNASATISQLLAAPNEISVPAATFLLIVAGLIGGVLEAIRTVSLDFLLARRSTRNLYSYVTPENLPLFEAGVENSYKYYCFYGNLTLALLLLFVLRLYAVGTGTEANWFDAVLVLSGALVAFAACEQHRKFEGFKDGFMDAEEQRRQERGTK